MHTSMHTGGRNDINKAKACSFVQSLVSGEYFPDYQYSLMSSSRGVYTQRGLWCVSDGGFPPWRVFQFPIKHSVDVWEMRWSKRLESVRKGSECRFGVDQKVFGILMQGFPWSDRLKCGKVFKFCAMLTNMTLRHDKYDTVGSEDSHWIRANTALDDQRIHSTTPATYEHYVDPQYSGGGEDEAPTRGHIDLRSRLIDHYRCAWKEGVFWMRPKREVVGVGARQRDMRPRAICNTPCLRPHWHSLASLCGSSAYGDPYNLDALLHEEINPHLVVDDDDDA